MRLLDLFRRRRTDERMTRVELTAPQSTFTVRSASAWQNPTFRAAVNAIATAASRMALESRVTFSDGSSAPGNADLNDVLRNPNPLQTSGDFLYRLTSMLYAQGNAFAVIERDDDGRITGLYPVSYTSAEFLADGAGELYVKLTLLNGRREILSYRDLLHLRRFQLESDTLGDGNGALSTALALSQAQAEGSIRAIEQGAHIRGILTFTQKLNAETLESNRKRFVRDYLSMQNDGGVIVTDPLTTYQPIESRGVVTSAAETDATDEAILRYLGVPRAIADGSFSDDQWASFEESVLEPLAQKLAQECTRKLLSAEAVRSGWEVQCSISSLQFISSSTKVQLLRYAGPLGLFSVNELRAIFGYGPVDGGDARLQSLNYIDSSIAVEHQLIEAGIGGIKSLGKGDE